MYIIEDLEMLNEERTLIKNKISKAMKDLKEWFLNKIDSVKEFYDKLKNKISDGFRNKIPSSTRITRDVSLNGEVLFKKGTPLSVVNFEIKKTLGEVNKEKDLLIRECKNGIIYISSQRSEASLEKKELVIKRFKQITKLTSIILAGVSVYRNITKFNNLVKDDDEYTEEDAKNDEAIVKYMDKLKIKYPDMSNSEIHQMMMDKQHKK